MRHYWLFVFLLSCSLWSSCVSYRDTLYFRGADEALEVNFENQDLSNLEPLTIRKNDVLVISVHSFDPVRSTPFNLTTVQRGVGVQNVNPFNSYLVNTDGEIEFPILGKVYVKGLTVKETEEKLRGMLREYLKDATVTARIANFRITVLGEVVKPGTFRIENDRVNVLEALGMAGDITSYGNRRKVLLIREKDDVREYQYLDLQSKGFTTSPYFYLKQGDVLYIEPNSDKEAAIRDKFTEAVPWMTAFFTAITTVLAIINTTSR